MTRHIILTDEDGFVVDRIGLDDYLDTLIEASS